MSNSSIVPTMRVRRGHGARHTPEIEDKSRLMIIFISQLIAHGNNLHVSLANAEIAIVSIIRTEGQS